MDAGLLCLVLVKVLFSPVWLFFVEKSSLFLHTTHFCVALLIPATFILLVPSCHPLLPATGGNKPKQFYLFSKSNNVFQSSHKPVNIEALLSIH